MDALPNRPAIRPDLAAVRRGPGEVQLGTNPEHALVVADLPEAFADELLALDGRLTIAELGERLEQRGEDPAQFHELLVALDGEGLLDRPRPRANVEVHGTDLLAAAIRSLLPPHTSSPDLVIVTGFPRPELIKSLMAARSPHLAVRAGEGVGVIGPLVLPGRTSCLTCADLHRTDRDDRWPAVAAQLSAKSPEQDEVLATATAAVSVTQALLTTDFLRSAGDRPPTWNATIELRPAQGTASQRSWYPHPDCPCGAHNMAW